MRCDEADNVSALVDGELHGLQRQAAEAHIASCSSCTAMLDDLRGLGKKLRAAAYERAPPDLGARLRSEFIEVPQRRSSPLGLSWTTLARHAAALLLVASLAGFTGWWSARTSQSQAQLQSDLTTAHVRSHLQDSPFQIASSDSHQVRPWFKGRLDYSPAVKDLAGEGFPLTGARLDYVDGRRVAVLIYTRRLHIINVFVWPTDASGQRIVQQVSVKGYNTVSWTAAGMIYWAMSDLNLAELKQFQSLL